MISNEDREYWSSMVGQGWKNIVIDTLDKMNAIAAKYSTEAYVLEVKEKFGTLRIYYQFDEITSDKLVGEIENVVCSAEALSEFTCERCGASGELRTHRRWLLTLCDGCNYKEDERMKS